MVIKTNKIEKMKRIEPFNIFGNYLLLNMFFILLLISLCSCAEDQNENDTDIPKISYLKKGQFIDTYVQGLEYQTNSQNGLTDSKGYFNYKTGETITFSIGNTIIGTCIAKQFISPLDIAETSDINNIIVLNISRLLQSLDIDGNLDNGIQINETIHDEMKVQIDFSLNETDFENNSEINDLFTSLNLIQVFADNKTRTLCSIEKARNHLENSLKSVVNFPYCLLESGEPMEKAVNVPDSISSNISNIVNYLIEDCENDFEKVKVLHDWIALNIAYAYDMYQSNNYGPMDAESVFKRRTGVCEGYSNLFLELCNIAHVTCLKIHGKSKGYGWSTSGSLGGHAWNSVSINDYWYLVDTTWDAGGIRDNKFVFAYGNNYLFTDPRIFISNHFPNDSKWQLLEQKISIDQFKNLPETIGHFGLLFEINNPLFEFPYKYAYQVENEFSFIVNSDLNFSLWTYITNEFDQTIDTKNLIFSQKIGQYQNLKIKFPEQGLYKVNFNFSNLIDNSYNFLANISYFIDANEGASFLFPYMYISENCNNILTIIEPVEYNSEIYNRFNVSVLAKEKSNIWTMIESEAGERYYKHSEYIVCHKQNNEYLYKYLFPETGKYTIGIYGEINKEGYTNMCYTNLEYDINVLESTDLIFPTIYQAYEEYKYYNIEPLEYQKNINTPFIIKVPFKEMPVCKVQILGKDGYLDTQNIVETDFDSLYHIFKINFLDIGEYKVFIVTSDTDEMIISYDLNYSL